MLAVIGGTVDGLETKENPSSQGSPGSQHSVKLRRTDFGHRMAAEEFYKFSPSQWGLPRRRISRPAARLREGRRAQPPGVLQFPGVGLEAPRQRQGERCSRAGVVYLGRRQEVGPEGGSGRLEGEHGAAAFSPCSRRGSAAAPTLPAVKLSVRPPRPLLRPAEPGGLTGGDTAQRPPERGGAGHSQTDAGAGAHPRKGPGAPPRETARAGPRPAAPGP